MYLQSAPEMKHDTLLTMVLWPGSISVCTDYLQAIAELSVPSKDALESCEEDAVTSLPGMVSKGMATQGHSTPLASGQHACSSRNNLSSQKHVHIGRLHVPQEMLKKDQISGRQRRSNRDSLVA